ncbi:uncharacterized protein PV07_10639 [Cladophialophora immunda]|uniref:Uncharacterized protein n=1 Tax=Cladophialophora immunda TaxID=569365 RepID=A0A0D2C0Z9_9EURO|nr:uncharacterized protein PV07_10639 [Cladophialophora immunda]KIW24963.1 hypothetical protein PV07_10639 [Cladophialophora immunda]OQV02778.1 hypothetical protein CLAIMM_07920 [Cladophialophora immunda]
MSMASSYANSQHVQGHDYRSRIASDVAIPSIEDVGHFCVKREKVESARPPRVKQEVEDDFEGENWLDADEDVLRGRLRKRGLKLDEVPLF